MVQAIIIIGMGGGWVWNHCAFKKRLEVRKYTYLNHRLVWILMTTQDHVDDETQTISSHPREDKIPVIMRIVRRNS